MAALQECVSAFRRAAQGSFLKEQVVFGKEELLVQKWDQVPLLQLLPAQLALILGRCRAGCSE